MTKWLATKDSRIKKRDGIYWARFMKKGRRVEQSLETRSFELAKHLVADIEGKLLAGKSWKKERQLFEDAWLEFLADKKAGNKVRPAREKTLHEYAGFGHRYFLPFFGKMRLGDIEEGEWLKFIEWVRAERGDILFFNIRKYFLGFMSWAKAHGKVPTPPYLLDPDARKNAEREEFSPGKAYTKEELKRMRDAAVGHDRFFLFMLMAQYMGMRPSEITQLQLERIDLSRRVIELKRADTKTKKGRVIPIHTQVMPYLQEQMHSVKGSTYLFPNRADKTRPMDHTGFKKVWYRIMEEAGVKGRIYDFRHTFITHAIEGGMNPAVVAVITGTSLRIIEKHYLHLGPNDLSRAMSDFRL